MDPYDLTLQALNAFNNTLVNSANMVVAANTSRQDRKFSREMSDLAYKRNIELWNMQNDYNLPANQYARQLQGLRENGLNPNLVYGSSSSIGGEAGSVSPYKFEGYHSTAVPQYRGETGLDSLLNTKLLQTQIQAAEANNRLVNARAANEENRAPGIAAKSDEASYRWNYIRENIADSYEAGIRAKVATEYWKGVEVEYNAHYAKDRSSIEYYEAMMAEWLNTEKVPGTDLTYQQYMERYKSMLPAETFKKVKAETLNYASQLTYRAKQGKLLDLKMEYQRAVNKFAWLGRSLGNNWANTLFSGLMWLWDHRNDPVRTEVPKDPVSRGASDPEAD